MQISDTVLVAITVAAAPTILALATLIVSIRNSRTTDDIKHSTDGMKDAMVNSARKEGHAEGVKDEKVRQADLP